jgi:hypothetical protein
VFGNVIAFPTVAYTFPWDTYLVDPSTYYIVQAESLGLLIAACIFIYEWVKYSEKPKFLKLPRLNPKNKTK